MRIKFKAASSVLALAITLPLGISQAAAAAETNTGQRAEIEAENLKAVGRVDERFQSYNVESVEVTGGNFWAPYPEPGAAPARAAAGPHGTEFSSGAYQKREPIDLKGNHRLRMLTKALGPAYMRVSGSWANNIYFQDDDQPMGQAPAGYQGVLTRDQWAGVVDFAKAVDARILTSFATSDGSRDKDGAWNPDQARRLFAYTASLGGEIDAVELSNEPNVRQPSYDPDLFARDYRTLRNLAAAASPGTTIVGPGSTGEAGFKLFAKPPEQASTARLLSGQPNPPQFDIFSHHFYGAVSQRCKSLGERTGTNVNTSRDEAMSEEWLSRADQAQNYYRGMRDRFAPGAPIWITETAQTACGGDPWSSTFLDTFRYVDQLGRFARNDVSVVFHNTLAASDYALIDDRTWLPRPNYWAALLWRRLMGEVVLDAGPNDGDLHVYAHCLRSKPGGVAIAAVNLSRTENAVLRLDVRAQRYELTAPSLESQSVRLNGKVLALKNDNLPAIVGASVRRGPISLAPASVTFFELPDANNLACH